MVQLVRHLVGNRRGQGLLEYALIVTLVGCCLVAILGLASTATRNVYTRTSTNITRQTSGGYGTVGGWSGSGVGTGAATAPDPEPEPDDEPPDSTVVQASRKS